MYKNDKCGFKYFIYIDMKAAEMLKKYDICRTTLTRWVKSGKVKFEILPSGRYNYLMVNDIVEKERKNYIYARVSSTTQCNNLQPQIERIKSFASANGAIIHEIYHEVASALNYNRKFYRKLYENVINGEVDTIYIEYKDRLLRIGFEDFENLCKLFNTKIVIIYQAINTDKSTQKEITDDLISIIHHFSSKIYSNRRTKKIKEALLSE